MTYAQLKALQSRGKYANMDPKAFAALMGSMVGDPSVMQPLADPSLLSRIEHGINTVVNATGLPEIAGEAGSYLFGETGRSVFEALPRGVVNMVPLAAAGTVGAPIALTGAGVLGALEGWGRSEQAVPALLSGALAAAVPGIAAVGEGLGVQATRRLAGDTLGELPSVWARGAGQAVGDLTESLAMSNLPRTALEMAGGIAGQQTALLGAGVATDALSIAADPTRTLDEMATPEYWAAQALGNLPFIGLDMRQGMSRLAQGKELVANAPAAYRAAWRADQGPPVSYDVPGSPTPPPLPTPPPSLIPPHMVGARTDLWSDLPPRQELGDLPYWQEGMPIPMPGEAPGGRAQQLQLMEGSELFARDQEVPIGMAKLQELSQWAADVRPPQLATKLQQEAVRTVVEGAGESTPVPIEVAAATVEPIVVPKASEPPPVAKPVEAAAPTEAATPKPEESFVKPDGLSEESRRQLERNLKSGDVGLVASTAVRLLPQEQVTRLQKIMQAKRDNGVPQERALRETWEIGRQWALSYISRKRTTNVLGSTAPLDESLSMSSRQAHVQMDLNDWIEQRRALAAGGDKTIQAELAFVEKQRQIYEKAQSKQGYSERPQNEVWQWYKNWVEKKSELKGAPATLETFIRRSEAFALKPESGLRKNEKGEVVMRKNKKIGEGDLVSRDEMSEDQMDRLDFELATKNVLDDAPDKVGERMEKIVRRKASRFMEAVFPQEITDVPHYAKALEVVKEGLFAGDDAQKLMDRLRSGVGDKVFAALAKDAEFVKGMKKAFSAREVDRQTLMDGLRGEVDPNMRSEIEQLLFVKELFNAEKQTPFVVDKMRAMLEMFGADAAEVARDLPVLARLWNFSKAFEGTQLAALRTDGVESLGVYARRGAQRLVGIGASRAKMASWIMAHELTGHGLWDAMEKGLLSAEHTEALKTFQKNVRGMSAQERMKMLRDAAASLPRHLRNDPEVQRLLETDIGHTNAEEVLANLNAIAALNLVEAPRGAIAEQIRYLPKWFGDMYVAAADYMRKIVDVLRGLVGGDMRRQFDAHKRNLNAIMREARANEIAAAQLDLYTRATEPGGVRDLLLDPQQAEAAWTDLWGDGADKLGEVFIRNLSGEDLKKIPHLGGEGVKRAGRWLAHTLQPVVQFGAFDKNFRLFASQQMEANQQVTKEIKQLMEILGASYDGTFTRVGEKGVEKRVMDDHVVGEALNKALLSVQKRRTIKDPQGKDVEVRMSIEEAIQKNDAEVLGIVKGLSTEQMNLLLEAAANRIAFHTTGMKKLLTLNQQFAAAQAATTSMIRVTGEPVGISFEPVYRTMLANVEGYNALPRTNGQIDPQVLAAFETKIAGELVTAGHEPAQAAGAAGSFVEMLKVADRSYARQMAHTSYVNESRHGEYKVSFTVPQNSAYGKYYGYAEGEHGYASAHSLEQAEYLAQLYRDKGLAEVKLVKPTDFQAQEHLKLTSDIEDIIKQETDNLGAALRAKGVDAKIVQDTLADYDLLYHINRDYVANKMGTLTITRRHAPGRESLNMGEQQVMHVQSLLRGAQRRINEAVFKGMTRDVKYRDSPESAAMLTSWKNNMAPDTQLTQAIAKFGYMYALGLNLPNYAQEWIQGITGFPAKLIDEGATWAEAYKYVGRAQRDTAKMQLSEKFLKGGELDTGKLSVDEASFIRDAMERGLMGDGMLSEMGADTLNAQYDKQKAAFGWGQETATSRFGQAAEKTFHRITRLHSKFTAGSTSTALLASYRFLRDRGMSHADAQKKAIVLFNEGMMIGGRYNRPAGLWDVGSARPVAAMISSLQSFTSNMIASTVNYARRAMDGRLPAGERKASAMAFANQMLVQMALAGVMGLPLVGPLLAVAEKSIGFDLQKEMTEMAANMEDPVLGALANQVALRGLFRAFGGPDVGARYGLGNVMGLNENDGFAFENLFGPVGSALGRSVTALGELAKGDPLNAAAEIAPVALRKPLKLWSDGWQFRSKEGNLLLENPTSTERALYALGLQPSRLSKAREAYNMTKRAREREHQSEIDFSKEVADTLQSGDVQGAQELLQTKAVEDEMDYGDLVERVVNALEMREFQTRPTREGTRQTSEVDAAIARGYGTQAPVDELARAQFKNELTVLLGGETNEKRLREAAVIDEMRKRNPFLTVRQAKILLDQQKQRSLQSSAGLRVLLGQ